MNASLREHTGEMRRWLEKRRRGWQSSLSRKRQAKRWPNAVGREARKVTRGQQGKTWLGRTTEFQGLHTSPMAPIEMATKDALCLSIDFPFI